MPVLASTTFNDSNLAPDAHHLFDYFNTRYMSCEHCASKIYESPAIMCRNPTQKSRKIRGQHAVALDQNPSTMSNLCRMSRLVLLAVEKSNQVITLFCEMWVPRDLRHSSVPHTALKIIWIVYCDLEWMNVVWTTISWLAVPIPNWVQFHCTQICVCCCPME